MRHEQSRRPLRWATCLLLAAALFGTLYTLNARSPRCEVASLSTLTAVPENGPMLLTGGQTYRDEAGRNCYAFSFRASVPSCLFFARAVEASINGETLSVQNETFPLEPGEEYEVVIRSGEHSFPYVANAVYFGSQEQVFAFLRFYAQVNAYIQGMCFTVMLISCVLLLYKQSERYLLWLALLCFFRGNYNRAALLLRPITWIPGLAFLTHGNAYLVVSELVTAVLQYKILQSFVPVKIGKLPFP